MTNRRDNQAAVPAKRQGLWGAVLLALSLSMFGAGAGCADHAERAVVTCPCARGVCCASGVCAADENSCEQATRALSSESAGQWTGYLENYTFPTSGSDAMQLTLHLQDDGSLSGELTMGQGTPPPPPTDGTVGWPPNYNMQSVDWSPDAPMWGWAPRVIEGFVYHVTNLRWTALRLRFEVNIAVPWTQWCEWQQSTFEKSLPGFWQCDPTLGVEADGGKCWRDAQAEDRVEVDCGHFALCASYSGPCLCTEAGCDISTARIATFDIALRGNEGNGSVADKQPVYPSLEQRGDDDIGHPHNVRLIRVSN